MKKNGKTIMIFLLILFFMVLTWIIPSGTYTTGTYVSNGVNPAGIFDIFVFIYYALTYKAMDIIFILMVGGAYGVLSKTKSYRKLVDKAGEVIRTNSLMAVIFFLLSTFVTGVFASLTNEIIILLVIAPFLVTIFLKGGKDRLTAISAGFGGMLIGMAGKTFGTFGISKLTEALQLTYSSSILIKLIVFVLVYMLYNLFAVIHMSKNGNVDETKYDMFDTEELDERKVKFSKRVRTWPFILVSVIVLVIALLAYISWETSFGVSLFANIYAALEGVKIASQPVITNLLGSVTGFGSWSTLFMNTVLFIGIVVIALIDRMPVNKFILDFHNGVRKMYKVAFMYLLVHCLYVLFYYFPIGVTIINFILGDGTFNVIKLFIIAFLALFMAVDYEIIGTAFGAYFAVLFAGHEAETSLIMQLGMSLAMLIVPTSYLLMTMLSYLDIPYSKWLKYIWKFALAFLWVIIVVIILVGVL